MENNARLAFYQRRSLLITIGYLLPAILGVGFLVFLWPSGASKEEVPIPDLSRIYSFLGLYFAVSGVVLYATVRALKCIHCGYQFSTSIWRFTNASWRLPAYCPKCSGPILAAAPVHPSTSPTKTLTRQEIERYSARVQRFFLIFLTTAGTILTLEILPHFGKSVSLGTPLLVVLIMLVVCSLGLWVRSISICPHCETELPRSPDTVSTVYRTCLSCGTYLGELGLVQNYQVIVCVLFLAMYILARAIPCANRSPDPLMNSQSFKNLGGSQR